MNKKSVFGLLIIMIAVIFAGIILTLITALIMGNSAHSLVDFSNMNFANMGVVLVIGIVTMIFVFMILLLIIAKVGFDVVYNAIKNKKWEEEK